MNGYIAGPMRGYEDYNFPAFNAFAEHLRGRGVVVSNPAEFDAWDEKRIEKCINLDLSIIVNWADAVYLLPGWKKSQGAVAEASVAFWSGKLVYEVEVRSAGGYELHRRPRMVVS